MSATTTLSLFQAYNFKPPEYHECKDETEDDLLAGKMARVNRDIRSNSWQLTSGDEASPLAGLSRMGSLDLVNHDENDNVVMVFSVERKSSTTRIMKNIQRALPKDFRYIKMKRGNGDVAVFKRVRVQPLPQDQLQNPQGKLDCNIDGNRFTHINISQCVRDGGKVELWKRMENKIKDTTDYLKLLIREQKEVVPRIRMIHFLLTESHGDELTSAMIRGAVYHHLNTRERKRNRNLEIAVTTAKKTKTDLRVKLKATEKQAKEDLRVEKRKAKVTSAARKREKSEPQSGNRSDNSQKNKSKTDLREKPKATEKQDKEDLRVEKRKATVPSAARKREETEPQSGNCSDNS